MNSFIITLVANGQHARLECSTSWVRVKPKTIKLEFVASPQIGWLGIRIMCPSGATCLPADFCFSELAL